MSICPHVVNRLMEAKRLPHLLFYGPPGTGKTSTILACAKQMFGSNLSAMVLEVSSNFCTDLNVRVIWGLCGRETDRGSRLTVSLKEKGRGSMGGRETGTQSTPEEC